MARLGPLRRRPAMPRREPVHRDERAARTARVRAYLRRFFTSWVAEDPDPTYSALDRSDGLGQVPDPICQPRTPVAESAEVSAHASGEDKTLRLG